MRKTRKYLYILYLAASVHLCESFSTKCHMKKLEIHSLPFEIIHIYIYIIGHIESITSTRKTNINDESRRSTPHIETFLYYCMYSVFGKQKPRIRTSNIIVLTISPLYNIAVVIKPTNMNINKEGSIILCKQILYMMGSFSFCPTGIDVNEEFDGRANRNGPGSKCVYSLYPIAWSYIR